MFLGSRVATASSNKNGSNNESNEIAETSFSSMAKLLYPKIAQVRDETINVHYFIGMRTIGCQYHFLIGTYGTTWQEYAHMYIEIWQFMCGILQIQTI